MQAVVESVDKIGILQTVRAWSPAKYAEILREAEARGPLARLHEVRPPEGVFETSSTHAGPFYLGPIGGKWLQVTLVHNTYASQNMVYPKWVEDDVRECEYRPGLDCSCGEDEDGDWVDCSNCDYGDEYCFAHTTYHN